MVIKVAKINQCCHCFFRSLTDGTVYIDGRALLRMLWEYVETYMEWSDSSVRNKTWPWIHTWQWADTLARPDAFLIWLWKGYFTSSLLVLEKYQFSILSMVTTVPSKSHLLFVQISRFFHCFPMLCSDINSS